MNAERLWELLDSEKSDNRFSLWIHDEAMRQRRRTKSKRWDVARAFVNHGFPCTGVGASWCPNCNECICDREEGMDHPDCPLHSEDSPHATNVVS